MPVFMCCRAAHIWLHAAEHNPGAMAFYKTQGFKPVGAPHVRENGTFQLLAQQTAAVTAAAAAAGEEAAAAGSVVQPQQQQQETQGHQGSSSSRRKGGGGGGKLGSKGGKAAGRGKGKGFGGGGAAGRKGRTLACMGQYTHGPAGTQRNQQQQQQRVDQGAAEGLAARPLMQPFMLARQQCQPRHLQQIHRHAGVVWPGGGRSYATAAAGVVRGVVPVSVVGSSCSRVMGSSNSRSRCAYVSKPW